MTESRWALLTQIVPEALATPPDERDAFLDRVCVTAAGEPDAELRAEAAALVTAGEEAEAADAITSPLAALVGVGGLPEHVGPWHVRGLLGEGGMGVVYRAERADGLYERSVALKRIRPGLGKSLAGRLELSLESNQGWTARLRREVFGTLESRAEYLARLRAITAAEVQRLALTWLDPVNYTLIVVRP